MVIRDLNEEFPQERLENPSPYVDRFFANVIDFLILVPIISLFCSGITNDLRWAIFNHNSSEMYLLFMQYGFISFALFLLYETLFIYFNGATPGHRFLYLRLTSDNGRGLAPAQIFFRTIFKFQSLLLAGVPFLELFIRPDRSMFYDRLSQTKIISLRPSKHDDVHPDLRKIVLRWAHGAVALVFLFIGLAFYQTVRRASNSEIALNVATTCQDTLGQYLRSYLSKSKESENLNCARAIVEKDFKIKPEQKVFNYLAQLVVSPNEELKEKYKAKYCDERPNKPLCKADWQVDAENFRPDEEDVVNLLIQMNASMSKNNHAHVFAILDLLYTHIDWNKNLELYYLTSYIFMNENQDRGPASEKENQAKWSTVKTRFLKRVSVSE